MSFLKNIVFFSTNKQTNYKNGIWKGMILKDPFPLERKFFFAKAGFGIWNQNLFYAFWERSGADAIEKLIPSLGIPYLGV